MLFDQQMEGDCLTQKDGSEVIVLQGWEGHGHEKKTWWKNEENY